MHRMDREYRGHGPSVWYGEAPQQQDVDQVIAKRSRPQSLGKYLVLRQAQIYGYLRVFLAPG